MCVGGGGGGVLGDILCNDINRYYTNHISWKINVSMMHTYVRNVLNLPVSNMELT